METWFASVHAGNLKEVAEWRGPARSAGDAEQIATRLTAAAYRIRTGRHCPSILRAEVTRPEDSSKSAPSHLAELTLWQDELLAGPPAGSVPHEVAINRAAQACLRLIALDAGMRGDEIIAVAMDMTSMSKTPDGASLLHRYRTTAIFERDDRPRAVDVGNGLVVAITALALCNGQNDARGRYQSLLVESSATLRAVQAMEMRQTRAKDVATVARFLQRLGLRDEAGATFLTCAPAELGEAEDVAP